MIRKILSNGLTVILNKRKSNSVVIEITAKSGSNNEDEKNLGISHFIEHLMFNGTKNRSSREIVERIESVGGEFNAITWNERTSFYVKLPSKYFGIALNVLSDCIKNSVFDQKEIDKERNIILSEIDIHNDTPTSYQWLFFQSKLFKKIKAKYPIIGTKETVKSINRKAILDFYERYYHSNNIIVTVVGNFESDIVKKIENEFKDFKGKKLGRDEIITEPNQTKPEEYIESRNLDHSYLMIGYKVPGRTDKESYVLDVIRIILGTGLSSRLSYEIRIKRGLGYSVGCHYDGNKNYGFFVAFVTTDKTNIKECKNIIINEYKKINHVSKEELEKAKRFIEGQYLMDNEDNFKRADLLSIFEVVKEAKLADSYIKEINNITIEDIKRVASKYFKDNYCLTILTN